MPLSAGPGPARNQPPALLFWAFGLLYAAGTFCGMPLAMTPALDSISPLGPLAFFAKYNQTNISTFIRLLCIRFRRLASTPSPYWAVSSLAL